MNEDQKREFVEAYILDLVNTVEYMDVVDALWENDIEDDDLALELTQRIQTADIEVLS